MSYLTEYQASIDSPEKFWADKAKQLPWFKAPEKILSDDQNGIKRWFADAQMNTCYMALDHHVANGRGEQIALIYDSPVTATKMQFTYAELLEKVARFAGLLQTNGVSKGDRVVIYLPMISEAVVAMLAAVLWN
jgi:propionyl-CoA synthetase